MNLDAKMKVKENCPSFSRIKDSFLSACFQLTVILSAVTSFAQRLNNEQGKVVIKSCNLYSRFVI